MDAVPTPQALARAAAAAPTLEDAARPLLRSLRALTGLDTAYLTRVEPAQDRLTVSFSDNAAPERLDVVEGSQLAWKDSICQRALQDETPVTDRADELWADVPAVRALGVRTYVGEPVWDAQGALVGTLCAVSDRAVAVDDDTREVLALFARIIGLQAERERRQLGAQG